MNKLLSQILVIIVVLAIGLRGYQLTQVPTGSYWDETAMLVDAKAVVATGLDQHGLSVWTSILPSYGDYKLPVYPWCVFLLAKVIGANIWAVRLPGLISGVMSIVLIYFLAKRLAVRYTDSVDVNLFGLASATILATSPWAFVFSRTGFESYLAQLFLALGVYCIFRFQHKVGQLGLALICLVLASYTYYAMIYIAPVVIFVAYFLTHLKVRAGLKLAPINWRQLGLGLILIVAVSYLSHGPISHHPAFPAMTQYRLSTASILNQVDYAVSSNQLRQWAGNHSYDRLLFHRDYLLLLALAKNIGQQLSPVTLFFQADTNLRHSLAHTGQFLWPSLVFLIIGLAKLVERNKTLLGLLLVWAVVAVVPASIPVVVPHSLRSLGSLMPLSLIMAWGLASFLSWHKNQAGLIKVKVMFLVAYGLVFVVFGYTYFVNYPVLSFDAWQTSYKYLAQTVYQQRKVDQPTLVLHADSLLYLWFMAYGPYSGAEFKTWPIQNYQYRWFDQIYFDANLLTDQTLAHLNTIAGNPDMVKSFIKNNFPQVGWSCSDVSHGQQPVANLICQRTNYVAN